MDFLVPCSIGYRNGAEYRNFRHGFWIRIWFRFGIWFGFWLGLRFWFRFVWFGFFWRRLRFSRNMRDRDAPGRRGSDYGLVHPADLQRRLPAGCSGIADTLFAATRLSGDRNFRVGHGSLDFD
jgi:hypothetical protein